MKPATRTSKSWAESDGAGRDSTVWGISGTAGQVLAIMGTIFLIVTSPLFVMFVNTVHSKFNGSVFDLLSWVHDNGIVTAAVEIFPLPSTEAWLVLLIFGSFEALLQLGLPGTIVHGPVTPKGNVPIYKANGVQAFLTTISLFGVVWYTGCINPARIYDLFGELLSALNIFAFSLCIFLYFKGRLFPSTTDSGSTGNIVYDFYWGMELYPRIGNYFDIKTWTNCRVGMMSWAVLILCYAAKQYEIYGHFFLWEYGYWCSMDIAHDRAGFYLCWGCLNWVPAVYTSPALYLVKNPVSLRLPIALFFLVSGLLCIYLNYDADRQRQEFRRKDGNLKIWGKAPIVIRAKYKTSSGSEKTSLLLASGWWGLARHFHYLPEILGAFFWTIPGLFNNGLQFFYVFFLTLLLMDRAYRDDKRCHSKYGQYWEKYCGLVPYKLIPGIF